jgi:hypothetical protein
MAENGLKTPVFGADKTDGRRNSRDGASKRRLMYKIVKI